MLELLIIAVGLGWFLWTAGLLAPAGLVVSIFLILSNLGGCGRAPRPRPRPCHGNEAASGETAVGVNARGLPIEPKQLYGDDPYETKLAHGKGW